MAGLALGIRNSASLIAAKLVAALQRHLPVALCSRSEQYAINMLFPDVATERSCYCNVLLRLRVTVPAGVEIPARCILEIPHVGIRPQ